METTAELSVSPATTSPTKEYVRWEEVCVSTDKGRREVNYNLVRKEDGVSDLAVVGMEKSLRHMSYYCVLERMGLYKMKLKSRRDVVDWLNSIVSDSNPPLAVGSLGCKQTMDVENCKKQGQHTKEFSWVGSPWNCEKKRRHYPSFIRNNVKISVHDFVYVLAEEDKRLVAYLNDLYLDSKGNKVVTVQWLHKKDEVGIVLPHSFNEREVFFSLCTQHLSIECIDGLAMVLSPQQFEKYMKDATHNQLEPFVCQNLYENDGVKPFDITSVKGYWNQAYFKSQSSYTGLNTQENANFGIGTRPKKKRRQLKGNAVYLKCIEEGQLTEVPVRDADHHLNESLSYYKNAIALSTIKGVSSIVSLPRNNAIKLIPSQYPAVGSQIEVLSEDSGIRGCWFRALIIKKRNDRVKVRYIDIKDAEDDANYVEEWTLSSKVAASDQLGIWRSDRKIIRPAPRSNKGRVLLTVDVGTIVDAWWHDGWWEGLVIRKGTEDESHVYFPGEKQVSVFKREDVRHCREWVENKWRHIKENTELATKIMSDLNAKKADGNSCDVGKAAQDATCHIRQSEIDDSLHSNSCAISGNDNVKKLEVASELLKDDALSQLKWKASKKRRRGSPGGVGSRDYEKFLITSSLKVDLDDCKYHSDSLFSNSVVTHLTSMVMSR